MVAASHIARHSVTCVPSIVRYVVGLWRQRQLVERVDRETLEWLVERSRARYIDV